VVLRGVFTTDTEDGEMACVLHLKIPNVPPVARHTQEEGS
jgi:hypothetical protein